MRVFVVPSQEGERYDLAPSERFELDLEQSPIGEGRRVAQRLQLGFDLASFAGSKFFFEADGELRQGRGCRARPLGPQMRDKVQAFSRHRAVIDYHSPYFEQLPLSVVPDANTGDFDILQAGRSGGRAKQLLLNILELQRSRAVPKKSGREM